MYHEARGATTFQGGRLRLTSTAMAVAAATLAPYAGAMTLNTDIPGLKIQWDNTLKYSNAFRVKSQNGVLLANPNTDDGDRNFGKGLISNRIDLLSELDVKYNDVGARISGAAWYDDVYNRTNDNPGFVGGAFPNQASVAGNEFTRTTRDLHGRKVEVLDAYVFGRFNLGDSRVLLRAGQHGLVWGESLFLGANAIAGAMAPVDVTKLISVPGTQFKEAIRPVPQISGQIQLTPSVTLGAYYQFRYEPNRLPAVGSYFSQNDLLVDGAERLLMGPAGAAVRNADATPKNSGQGGVQLRVRAWDTDFGLYALRFHSKSPQFVSNLVNLTPLAAPTLLPGSYYVAYHQGIKAFGASASRTFGNANVAVEASVRHNQDLASAGHPADVSRAFGMPQTNNTTNPAYAVGRTAHVNVSMLWSLEPMALFNEATMAAEVAWNRVLSCQLNCQLYDPQTHQGTIATSATRDAASLRIQFEPSYRQVFPGLDLSVPIGIGYTPKGSRSMFLGSGTFPGEGSGDLTLGLSGSYLDGWRFTLAYTRYFGRAKTILDSATNSFTYGQSLRDRDFIAFSLRRAF